MKTLFNFENASYELNNKIFTIKHLQIKENQGLIRLNAPNGFGKTMLINFICGIYKPSSGIYKSNIDSKKLILINDSYLGMYEHTFEENVKWLINDIYKIDFNYKKNEIFEQLNVNNLKNQEYGKCSKGTQQKINIIPLFYEKIITNSNLIILDEIFIGLDSATSKILINKIASICQKNITTIIVEHNDEIFAQISNNINNYMEININNLGEYIVKKVQK